MCRPPTILRGAGVIRAVKMDDDTRKTIIMVGVFGFAGMVIMLSRLAMRTYRKQEFNLSDYLTIAAIVCLAARSGFTTVVVLWGNNNLTDCLSSLEHVH